MVDAEDVLLGEIFVEYVAELLGRLSVAPERLFDHETSIVRAPRIRELARDLRKEERRNGEIVQGALGVAQLFAQFGEHFGVRVVTRHVMEQAQELLEGLVLDVAAMGLDAVLGAFFELVERPFRAGDARDGDVQPFIADEAVKRGEYLFVGEIAARAEKDERVGNCAVRGTHGAAF